MATALKPPVSSVKVTAQEASEMVEAVNALGPGEFASDGAQYDDRKKASSRAASYIRVIESRENLKLRSRTWEAEPGQWVFGIRTKDAPKAKREKKEKTEK